MVNLEPMPVSNEMRKDADLSGLMHGEYAGACEACEGTACETKDFDGIVLCPMCRAGVGEAVVLKKREMEACDHEYESDGGSCIHCGNQGGLLH